jgi:hypothetical protein
MTSIPYVQAIDSLMHSNVSTRLDCFYTINSLANFYPIQDSIIGKHLNAQCNTLKPI